MNAIWSGRLLRIVPVLAMLLVSCASSPVVTFEGEEELPVIAQTWKANPADAAVPGRFAFPNAEPLEGVLCTMRNDKGTWSATTPAKVTVQVSAAPLRVDCTREGYQPVHFELQCRSHEQVEAHKQNVQMAIMILDLPKAIVGWPAALVIAAQEHGKAHAATDMCRYGFVAPTLKPQ